jgi:putative thiamine transport system ATP-binding protein
MTLEVHLERLGLRHQPPLVTDWRVRIEAGTIHTLMGPSGCGKSSVLAWLSGTLDAAFEARGSITLHGKRIESLATHARRLGQVFQDPLLFPHLSVEENLLFATPPGPKAARQARVAQALESIELGAFAQANPATLSGGQQSRVALVRALLAQPQAILLDEPFSKLDANLRSRMREWVYDRLRAQSLCALVVTHDPTDIADPGRLTQL